MGPDHLVQCLLDIYLCRRWPALRWLPRRVSVGVVIMAQSCPSHGFHEMSGLHLTRCRTACALSTRTVSSVTLAWHWSGPQNATDLMWFNLVCIPMLQSPGFVIISGPETQWLSRRFFFKMFWIRFPVFVYFLHDFGHHVALLALVDTFIVLSHTLLILLCKLFGGKSSNRTSLNLTIIWVICGSHTPTWQANCNPIPGQVTKQRGHGFVFSWTGTTECRCSLGSEWCERPVSMAWEFQIMPVLFMVGYWSNITIFIGCQDWGMQPCTRTVRRVSYAAWLETVFFWVWHRELCSFWRHHIEMNWMYVMLCLFHSIFIGVLCFQFRGWSWDGLDQHLF